MTLLFSWGKEENRIFGFKYLTLEEEKSLFLNILFICHAEWELKAGFCKSETNPQCISALFDAVITRI